jgi:hypothetical protein
MGVPPDHPFFHRMFHYKPSSYWGIPPFMETHIYHIFKLGKSTISTGPFSSSQTVSLPDGMFVGLYSTS